MEQVAIAVNVPIRNENVQKSILVLGALIGLAVGFAAVYFGTLSVFLKPIAGEFGWGRGQLSAVALMAMVGQALGAPLVGRMVDRYGAPRVIGSAIVLMALGLVAFSALPASIAVVGGLSFLLGIVGVASTPAGYLTLLPKYFSKRLGLALGTAMVGIGIGAVGAPILAQELISTVGWRNAYIWLAGIALVFGLFAVLLTAMSGSKIVQEQKKRPVGTGQDGLRLSEAIRTVQFWVIAAMIFVVSSAGLGAFIHMVSLLTDRGVSAPVAATAAGMAGLGMVLGRFIAGALMDWIDARYVAAGSFLLGALGLVSVALIPSDAQFIVIAISMCLIGFTLGAEGDLIPFLVKHYFGLKAFGTIYGLYFSAYSLGGVVGPIVFGATFDRTGSYVAALLGAALACVFGVAAALTLGQYKYGKG